MSGIIATIQGGAGIVAEVTTKQIEFAPVGWDNQISAYGRGHNYPPPTGQTTVYRTGDDADIEATIFTTAVREANSLKVQNSLVNNDPLTLNNTNSFGNLLRFTDILGGSDFAGNGNLLIDNYTGLMWYLIYISGIWESLIDAAVASTQGGHSDWFIANMKQVLSIYKKGLFAYSPFDTVSRKFSSSSGASSSPSTKNTLLQGNNGFITNNNHITSNHAMLCRKHF